MNPGLFDSHVHLDLLPDDLALDDVLAEANQAGIGAFLLPGVSRSGWPRLLEVARQIPGAVAAPGLHPGWAEEWNPAAADELRRVLSDPRCRGLGEIGLDGLLPAPAQLQEEAFVGQLRVALDLNLPVLLHCRRAHDRALELLRKEGGGHLRGVFHSFSGSLEVARQAVGMGFLIGISGVVTFSNARRLPAVVKELPEESLLLETDAPDLAPEPWRGQVNRPAWLLQTAAAVARLRGWSLAETAAVTTRNARRLFGLADPSSNP